MTHEITRFKVTHEDGKGYSVYYKKNGRCYAYNNSWDERRGILIMSPTHRITNKCFETSLPMGKEF